MYGSEAPAAFANAAATVPRRAVIAGAFGTENVFVVADVAAVVVSSGIVVRIPVPVFDATNVHVLAVIAASNAA